MPEEQHQRDHADHREQKADRHRDLRHEHRAAVVAVAHGPQHRQRVGEGGHEQPERALHEPVPGEGAQQPRRELAAGQLQRHQSQRERQRRHRHHRAGDGCQQVARRRGAPAEDPPRDLRGHRTVEHLIELGQQQTGHDGHRDGHRRHRPQPGPDRVEHPRSAAVYRRPDRHLHHLRGTAARHRSRSEATDW